MSFHDPKSDVSRINGAETGWEVSHRSAHISRAAFCSPAVGPFRRRVRRYDGACSSRRADSCPTRPRQTIPGGATYLDLDLLPDDRARWRRKGWIDLGGIAKGYAIDCGVAALRGHGVATGIVNAGGDLRCFGEAQPIHIRHPNEPMALMRLGWLADAALATSAGYFSGIDVGGRQIDPLVDPRRHRCVSWDASISVAAPDGMIADALTKVVRLAPDSAPEILDRFGAQAIVIDHEGARCCGQPLLQLSLAA